MSTTTATCLGGLDVGILRERVRCPWILLFLTPRQVWLISHQSSYRPCMHIASSVEAQWVVTGTVCTVERSPGACFESGALLQLARGRNITTEADNEKGLLQKHACLFSPYNLNPTATCLGGLDVGILRERVRCPLILLFLTPRQVWVISHQSSYRPCREAQWVVTHTHTRIVSLSHTHT